MKKTICALLMLSLLLCLFGCAKESVAGAWAMDPMVVMQDADGNDVTVTTYYVFMDDGTGYTVNAFSDESISPPVRGDFTYTLSGDQLTIDLSYEVPQGHPDPVTHTIKIDGNTLTFSDGTETITMTHFEAAKVPQA